MSWRNHANHNDETKAVKQTLAKAGYGQFKVGHGNGTAWAWLNIRGEMPKPANCQCEPGGFSCRPCRDLWNDMRNKLIAITQQVTGRHGEYSGEIGIHIHLI